MFTFDSWWFLINTNAWIFCPLSLSFVASPVCVVLWFVSSLPFISVENLQQVKHHRDWAGTAKCSVCTVAHHRFIKMINSQITGLKNGENWLMAPITSWKEKSLCQWKLTEKEWECLTDVLISDVWGWLGCGEDNGPELFLGGRGGTPRQDRGCYQKQTKKKSNCQNKTKTLPWKDHLYTVKQHSGESTCDQLQGGTITLT